MDKQHSGDMSEALCGLMDGELEASETQFLLRRLDHDQALRERWARYHQARSVMQDHHSGTQGAVDAGLLSGFAARVALAVADEPLPQSTSGDPQSSGQAASGGLRRWLQPAAGMAVAASVPMVAFNAWQPETITPVATPAAQALLSQSVENPTGEFDGRVTAPPSNIASQAAASAGNETLQRYLIRHTQVSSAGHRLPLIYVVSDSSTKPSVVDEDEADSEQQTTPVTRP